MKKYSRKIMAVLAAVLLTSCADPAFERYVESRQAAIAGMPNGRTKYEAQLMLDQQVYAEKQRQQAQAQRAAMAVAAGLAYGAAAAGNYGGGYCDDSTVVIIR
jgi:hypothetical protein